MVVLNHSAVADTHTVAPGERGENAGVDFPGVSLPGYEEGIRESMLGTDQRIERINLKEGANQII